VGGIEIAIGKLAVYIAAAGLHPRRGGLAGTPGAAQADACSAAPPPGGSCGVS
jgi:hypothetical protein